MENCGNCYKCLYGEDGSKITPSNPPQQMIVCPICGNKRCPKASDHMLDCTGSNEPGQVGSVYS